MADRARVPQGVLAKLRLVCSGLPEVVEEQAWAGTRWCVRKKNFAHALTIEDGWPPAYAVAAQTNGPVCVLTFRLSSKQLKAPRYSRAPFFRPVWFHNIAGVQIDAHTDWEEIETLLVESYCVLAPKNLVEKVDRVER
jgi:hypothetical protein